MNSVNPLKYSTNDHSLSNYQNIKVGLPLLDLLRNYLGIDHQKLDSEEFDQLSFEQNELNGVNNFIQQLKIEQEEEKKVSQNIE